ncbi:hypothetical protein [Caulobacter segnis]|uniref:hypothetical protein n=1 Tax=Caulobacter segnis TaxID=88688 RepID=UPI00285F131B|nr:hypothetical protein [Caulobacter segnis]MDR6624848.1 hypothetical protein [Caulobacter segnis]
MTKLGGIQPMYEVFYLEALTYSAGRAKDAFERFDQAVEEEKDAATIVATAHEALTHVAALSRFFWPGRDKPLHKARAETLRKAFGLDDASPLADRSLRNVLEHFDERLDEFLLQDMAGFFFPSPMVDDASLNDDALGFIFRLVDPRDEIFVLLGERHAFGPLRTVVDEVLEKAHRMDGQGGRLFG